MFKRRVYLDYASITPQLFSSKGKFFNPMSFHKEGHFSKNALDKAREVVSRTLVCKSEEIVFTSGGTESNNLALMGFFKSCLKDGFQNPHFITTNIEHPSVLEVLKEIESLGGGVSYMPVEKDGLVSVSKIIKELKDNTVMVSVSYANSEIGTIQPIASTKRALKKCGREDVLVHTDASQAGNYLSLNVQSLGIDLMSLDGSKIYGPRSTGALFVKRGVKLEPILFGGGQESGMRSGTQNVSDIKDFSMALKHVQEKREVEHDRLDGLRKHFINGLLKIFPDAILNGSKDKRLPNNVNIYIPGIDSEYSVALLDSVGIACSGGSACQSIKSDGSYVLKALGQDKSGKSSIRFSLGFKTSKSDLDFALKKIPILKDFKTK